MLELRPYQERAIAALRASYQRGRRAPCLVMPCGAGKTIVAASIMAAAAAKGTRCLFVADRSTLIDQTVAKLAMAGVDNPRVIQAARDEGMGPITVASAQTLRLRDDLPEADLVIWDECHGVAARTYGDTLKRYPAARLLGLTATPCRGDNRPLDVYDDLIIGATVAELTALGRLARPRVLPPPQGALKAGQIALDPLTAYQRHAGGKRAAVFCSTRKQAREYTADFVAAGISAEVVTDKTRDRSGILARFASGAFQILCSVGCLTQGWDDPGCGVAIIARAPDHVGLWLQICGRVLRPHPDKTEGLILDLGGAFWLHGPPDLEREYSLAGKAISSVVKDSLTQCPTCGSAFLAGPRACPYCGAALPASRRALPKVAGVDLVDAPAAPVRYWVTASLAKYPGRCSECAGSFPAGTPIYAVAGKRGTARHQRCPLPTVYA